MKTARLLLVASVLAGMSAAHAGQEPIAPPADGPEVAPEVEAYNPDGRRDPFRPFTLDVHTETRIQLTPLQRYELGQLTVVATVWAASAPLAMLEDSVGMGYIVAIGTSIGRNGGVVTAIEPERVVVEEHILDFYGKEQVNRIVMETPKEDPNQPVREPK